MIKKHDGQLTNQTALEEISDCEQTARTVAFRNNRDLLRKISRKSSKRRFGYYRVLLLVYVVLLAAICAGTVVFWKYIEAYEISRHEHVIQSLRENIDYDFWVRCMETALSSQLSVFEADRPLPSSRHLARIYDARFTFRQKADETTIQAPVYIVRAGANDIGVVRLVPGGSAGFGLNMWDVGSIEFLETFVSNLAKSVSITASQNAVVKINGIQVPQEHLVECEYEYGATYLVHGIFGDVSIEVFEHDGSLSESYYAENDTYLFPIIRPFFRSFSILLPTNSALYIDGQLVSQEKISTSDIIPEIFEGEIDINNIPLFLSRYEFEQGGFYNEPLVTATYKDIELLPQVFDNGDIHFDMPFSSELNLTHAATAEAFIRAYVRFGANIGGDVSANYSAVSRLMLRNTDLFRRTTSAIATMEWFGGAPLEYRLLEIDNFRSYGEEFFTCEVRYNITQRTNFEMREIDGHFEILFILSGGNWLAAKILAI